MMFDNGKPQRIILHWSAGTNDVSQLDREHYHFIVAGDGSIVRGKHTVADNDSTNDNKYAAHTLGCNTGSIGVALAGMAGAVENPPHAGKTPITLRQWAAAADLVAALCKHYAIKVTPRTVLSHAEVQNTLGIKQRGKWDIAWLPWSNLRGAKQCGDTFRAMVAERLLEHAVTAIAPAAQPTRVEPQPAPLATPPPSIAVAECQPPTQENTAMLPLVPTLAGIALSAAPEIARFFGGANGAKAMDAAVGVIKAVTGTDDPVAAVKVLETPEAQALLREQLLQSTRVYEIEVDDRKSARQQTVELAKAGSPIAYGAPIISAIVIIGFFAVLALMLGGFVAESRILDTMLGLLGAAFMSVINYYVGSSSGSAAKNATIDSIIKRG